MAELTVGVMGAGAIGCYVGGMLASQGVNVVLIGRDTLKKELEATGLLLSDLDGKTATVPPGQVRFETDPTTLAGCDVVLCCVKSPQSAETGTLLAKVLPPHAMVLSLQNGVRNPDVLRGPLGAERVLATVVGFNVISKGGGVFKRTTSGALIVEATQSAHVAALVIALAEAGFQMQVEQDIRRHQWAKLVVNLNNAVSALSDTPTRDILVSSEFRKILAAVMGEALRVLRVAGIRPAPFGIIPVGVFPPLLKLPTPLFRLLARAQLKVDPEARSSMWEDLKRGRTTEVEDLNGEVVRLAEAHHVQAPFNRRMVELVHQAEARKQGSPRMSAVQLWTALTT